MEMQNEVQTTLEVHYYIVHTPFGVVTASATFYT
jgi:hypothetical protein